MDINTLNDFFKELSNDEMSLLYSGDFSDEVTSKVIGLSGAQFDDGSDMNKMQRKTGFLIAECFPGTGSCNPTQKRSVPQGHTQGSG